MPPSKQMKKPSKARADPFSHLFGRGTAMKGFNLFQVGNFVPITSFDSFEDVVTKIDSLEDLVNKIVQMKVENTLVSSPASGGAPIMPVARPRLNVQSIAAMPTPTFLDLVFEQKMYDDAVFDVLERQRALIVREVKRVGMTIGPNGKGVVPGLCGLTEFLRLRDEGDRLEIELFDDLHSIKTEFDNQLCVSTYAASMHGRWTLPSFAQSCYFSDHGIEGDIREMTLAEIEGIVLEKINGDQLLFCAEVRNPTII